MKKQLLFWSLSFCYLGISAQNIVSTTPENKKVLLEVMTGTACSNCPAGATTSAGIVADNPGNVFIVSYHPTNSSYTASDPMKDAFADAFYSTPFLSSRYMPGAMISRRVFDGNRLSSRTAWAGHVDEVKMEASPINVGVEAFYVDAQEELTIDIEMYFTDDVTENLTIYAYLLEDGIIASQSGGSANYEHNNVFREAFPKPTPQQWGEVISGDQTEGELKTFQYTFDNSSTAYSMENCKVVVMIRNADDEEIITGNQAEVNVTSLSANNFENTSNSYSVYPNPLSDHSVIDITVNKNSNVNYTVYNMLGQKVEGKELGVLSKGKHKFDLNTANFDKGIYFVSIVNGNETKTIKVVK